MKPRHQNPFGHAACTSSIRGLCTVTLSLLAAGHALAQDTWDGGGTADGFGNYNWMDGNNWVDNGAPTSGALTFSGTTNTTTYNNNTVGTSFGGISFANTVAGQSFTLGGNAITLGGNITTASAAGAITDTINLNLILNGNRNIDGHDNRTVIVNGIISQNDSTARNLTKGGGGSGGTLTLTGNNTYTGNTIIETGTLNVTKIADAGSGLDSNMGYGTKFLLGNGNTTATLNYTGSGNTTARTLDISSSTGNNNGGATINQNGANGGSGLVFSATNFTNTVVTTAGERTLTLGGSNTDANQISGIIANMDEDRILKLTKSGAGRWILAGASTYTGQTQINNGTLEVKTLDDAGFASSLGRGTTNSVIRVGDAGNTGTLIYTGSTASDTNRQIQIGNGTAGSSTGGSTIRNNGTGANILEFTNAAFNAPVATGTGVTGATTRTLTLGGTNTGLNRIAGVIADNTGTETPRVAVTKEDAGQWILEGTNTYTGATSVTGGTLRVNGTHISATVGANYTVSNTDTTLGGNGRLAINGNVSVGSGAYLSPGASIGTLTLDGVNTTGNVLTMTSGSKLGFELAGNGGTPDRLDFWNYVAGDLVLNGSTIDLSLLGAQAAGTYNVDIFRFFSDGGGTAATHAFSSGLTIGTLGTGISGATIDWDGTGDSNQTIALNYTVVPEPRAALLGGLGLLALLRRRRRN